MGLFSFLNPIKKVSQPIEAVGSILDSLFTSDEERLDKKIILERLLQNQRNAQIELNKIEAQHNSIFVSGWRPAVGWVCSLALFWHFIGYDLLVWLTPIIWPAAPAPPALNGTETLVTVLLSLLGLGGLRTVEKINHVARE